LIGPIAEGRKNMTNSEFNEHRIRTRSWVFAIIAIALWFLLATNSADAQQIQVPQIVLAQVLGHDLEVAPTAKPSPEPAANLVANRIRQQFKDQIVAGVTRPAVELEVHFAFDSDRIDSESGPQIAAAAQVLNQDFPETRFRVAGFTDAAGSTEYNQQLSERRAIAVWEMLVEQHGVGPDRLERVGFGEDDPVAGGDDAQRRRVELQILRTGGASF
jgi:outer membrane protein OmpA-like peptidoglycan-associated protein